MAENRKRLATVLVTLNIAAGVVGGYLTSPALLAHAVPMLSDAATRNPSGMRLWVVFVRGTRPRTTFRHGEGSDCPSARAPLQRRGESTVGGSG